jgi:catechol 2,3-dioxygenase-like lactoylglutathione lyase family enzyme
MIDHTGIGVTDVGRSAAFYDAVLGALDLRRVIQLPENEGTDGIGYGVDYPIFWIVASARLRSVSISPSRPRAGPRSSPSTPPPCRRGAPTTEHRACARGATRPGITQPSGWIQTATT